MVKEQLKKPTKLDGLLSLVEEKKKRIDSFELRLKTQVSKAFDCLKKCNKKLDDLKRAEQDLVIIAHDNILTLRNSLLNFIRTFFSLEKNSFELAKRGKLNKAILKAVNGLSKSNPYVIQELIKSLDAIFAELSEIDSVLAQEILEIIRQLRRLMSGLFKRKQHDIKSEYYFNTLEENRKFSHDMREKLDLFRKQLKPKSV